MQDKLLQNSQNVKLPNLNSCSTFPTQTNQEKTDSLFSSAELIPQEKHRNKC